MFYKTNWKSESIHCSIFRIAQKIQKHDFCLLELHREISENYCNVSFFGLLCFNRISSFHKNILKCFLSRVLVYNYNFILRNIFTSVDM